MTFLAVGAVLFALTRLQLIVPDSTILKPEIFNRILSASSVTNDRPVRGAVPDRADRLHRPATDRRPQRRAASLEPARILALCGGRVHDLRQLPLHGPEITLSPLPPLSDEVFSPSHGVDAWIGGVGLATLGFVCFAIKLFATLAKHARARHGLAPRSDLHLGGCGGLRHAPRRGPGDAGGAGDADGRPAVRRRVLRPRRGRRAAPLLAPELDLLHRRPHDPGGGRRRR